MTAWWTNPDRRNTILPRLLLALVILTYFAYYGSYAVQRHLTFETGAFDVGVYAQPLWNYLNGNDFVVTIQKDNGLLRWANHVEPILFLILPIYWLRPEPTTILLIQVGAIALAGLPLFGIATRRLGSQWVALLIVIAFFLMPAVQSVTLFDFHAVAMAPLFLLSAIYWLDVALESRGRSFWLWPERPAQSSPINGRRAYILTALFFVLALSTKEDISLHVFMIGVYLLIFRRLWPEGSVLTVTGLVWFYVTFQLIIPAFRTGGGESIFISWFETLGETPLEIALSPLTAPDKVIALVFRADSIAPLAMLTVPFLLLPWLGLPLFGLTAPSLAFVLLGQNPTLRQLETWHYAAPMLAFVALGTIDGLARLQMITGWLGTRFKQPTLSRIAQVALPLLVIIAAGVYHNLRGYSPLSRLAEWPEQTAHHALGRELAQQVPDDAPVLAQAQLIPHISHRYDLAIWSGPLIADYEYIWIDLSHHKLPNRFNAHGDFLTGMIIEHRFGAIAAQDGYLILKRDAERGVIPADLFTFTEYSDLPADAERFDVVFGDTLRLVGVKTEIRRLATSETEPQVVLYFEVLQTPPQDYQLFLYRLDESGNVVGATDYPQPALFWWSTSRWQAGDKRQVRVNSIPWWTGDERRFGYAIGLSTSQADINEAPWDVNARLPISDADNQVTLEENTLLPIAAFQRFAGLPYSRPLDTLDLPSSEIAIR